MDELQFLPIPQKAPQATTTKIAEVPKLTPGETWLLYLTITLLLAVGTLGLVASFQSVTAAAALWGFETPQLLPISIDLAIPGFTIANLLLIRMDMELAWVRAVPWALTYTTVYLNIQAGTSLAAKLGHGALPLVWVVCSEIAGHVYRALIGKATGKRMERIRRARLVMAPLRTSALWRRMILWEETSYTKALIRERARILARADLRERYGRRWRWKAPIRERALLRLGELIPEADRERMSVSAKVERERLTEPSTERPTLSTTERPALTAPLTSAATKALSNTVSVTPERQDAPAAATDERAAPERPERPRTSAKPQAERKVSAPTVSALTDARSAAVRPLYLKLERRPEWTEVRDALTEAGHAEVSRPTAQRIRERVEKHHPELAAIATSALTNPPTAEAR